MAVSVAVTLTLCNNTGDCTVRLYVVVEVELLLLDDEVLVRVVASFPPPQPVSAILIQVAMLIANTELKFGIIDVEMPLFVVLRVIDRADSVVTLGLR